ncbi:hypothetical protein K3720_11985 [Leisingera caerulea]|uniref:hypothetical protein n=1 Tax=Leisingera caerulea TaxID=506591 RepID=UPI0021A7CED3|nr:hypothetical protein [Leisingera caerulea]UWQ48651.1 hypothetical protein K3720_11985 [Leisingera caerulea]
MKLITQFELVSMSIAEIKSLHRKVEQDTAAAEHGSRQERNGLASLANIKRALAMRGP